MSNFLTSLCLAQYEQCTVLTPRKFDAIIPLYRRHWAIRWQSHATWPQCAPVSCTASFWDNPSLNYSPGDTVWVTYLSCLSVSKQHNRDQDWCVLNAVGPVVGRDILADFYYVANTTEYRVTSNRTHSTLCLLHFPTDGAHLLVGISSY